jgi:hypothetical protein
MRPLLGVRYATSGSWQDDKKTIEIIIDWQTPIEDMTRKVHVPTSNRQSAAETVSHTKVRRLTV